MVSRSVSSSLRVIQVTTDDDRRGGQIFATDLQRGLRQLGDQVRTVCLARGDLGGLDIDPLGPSRKHWRTLSALRAELDGVDVIVAHGSTTLPLCAIAGAWAGVPFVYRQISDSLFWANTHMRRVRVRWGLRRAARVVALWAGAAETLSAVFGVPSGRIDRIPNAVPVENYADGSLSTREHARTKLRLPSNATAIAYVGALVHEKGVDTAIDAVGRLDDTLLIVAGDGPERRALEARAARLGSRVQFLGSVEDPRHIYAAADVVVLPSRGGDSMPATLIEAGLMGRPAISTPVGAIPEIVRDGSTGLLVPPDDVAALMAAVARLSRDPDLRASCGAAASAHCHQHFSLEVVAMQWARTLRAARTYAGLRC